MSSAGEVLESRVEDGILVLTLNRPAKLNALSPALIAALTGELDRAAADGEVRVVLLLGAGRSFCAGADVHESLGIDDLDRAEAFLDSLGGLLRRISQLPKPVVAGVQGHAVGGGAELAIEADLRIAAEDATLAFPDVGLGSTPVSLHRLVRLVGWGRATEMAMLGSTIDAAEMEARGAVTAVVGAGEIAAEAMALAGRVRDAGPARSLRFAKDAVRLADGDREADLAANMAAMLACHLSPEQRAYVRDFPQ